MFRPIALTALAVLLAAAAVPALAQDDFSRQLINQCVGCRLPTDMHGRDLHGLHFVGDDLRGVDFSHANLNAAVFTGCDLENAKFDDADLRNARFVGAHLSGATFARAKMDGISMRGADLGSSGSDRSYGPIVIRGLDDFAGGIASIQVERRLRDLQRRLRNLDDDGWIIIRPPLPPSPPPAPPAPPARP